MEVWREEEIKQDKGIRDKRKPERNISTFSITDSLLKKLFKKTISKQK